MKPKKLTPFQALRRSIQMVFQAAPKELRFLVLFNLLNGAGPSISLFFGKVVIDEATRLVTAGGTDEPLAFLLSQPVLLWSLLATIFLNLLTDAVEPLGTALYATMRDRIQGYVQGRVLEKVAYFNDIALFESPDLLNLIELCDRGITRIQRLASTVQTTMLGTFTFIPAVLVSASIDWWVPLVLFCASAPSIFVEVRYRRKSWRVEATQAGVTRKMGIYSKTVTGEDYAKEVRLFSLQGVLLDRWRTLFQQMFTAMTRVRRDGALEVMVWSLVGGLGVAVPYGYVILGVLRGQFTLGDIALYTGIILQLHRSLYLLIGNISSIYDVSLATAPIFQLLDLEPQIYTGTQPLVLPSSVPDSRQGMQVSGVSFIYPGAEKPVLHDINLSIRPGEMVALVGENGAGKTTLAKLICRLYDPTEGEIFWNGQNLRSLSLDDVRSRIGVVMQDYARFPATLRENVGWGHLPEITDDDMVHAALNDAGIDSLSHRLEHGLETPLGKQLEHGTDLSGGQWQRVAIARALMRIQDVELLVFDEPTAALDPKNEHELYQIFRKIAQGRMTVVVSHRLSLAKIADRIIVLEHGRIIESGHHDDLMALGGQYYTMFTRQASSYI